MDNRLASSLESGEHVLWEGRPVPARLCRASLPTAALGAFLVVFAPFWTWTFLRGNRSDWDHGKDVGSYPPHKILIAMSATLILLPPGFLMLVAPLRALRRGKETVYAVTDRRALLIEPEGFDGHRTRVFGPDDLVLMYCRERTDGSGDLVFGSRKTPSGTPEPIGFLGIDGVREVEDLLRRSLLSPAVQDHVADAGDLADDRVDSGKPHGKADQSATYSLPFLVRCGVGAFSVMVLLILAILAVDVLIIPVVIALGVLPIVGVWRPLAAIGALLGLLLACRIALAAVRWLMKIPVEIVVHDDGDVTFRGLMGFTTVPIRDFVAIRTGGWRDPNSFYVILEHKGGKLNLINRFTDFRRFLLTVRASNPRVEITGF